MKKAILIFLAVLLLMPIQLSSQEKKFRIITTKLDTFFGRQHYKGKKVIVIDSTGETKSIRPRKILSIREEISGWEYFEWSTNEFTDYLKISIDSVSQEELFRLTKEWIKEYFVSTKHGYFIEQDSIFKEKERAREKFRQSLKDGAVLKKRNLPKIIPELKDKFSIDEENYKITLVGCNNYIFNGLQIAMVNPITFYRVNFTFLEGEYQIDPIDLFYFYSFEDTLFGSDPDFFDYLLNDANKSYYANIPISITTHSINKSGIIHRDYRCLISRIEVLFNNLNKSLFNYIQGVKDYPNNYVYYPESSCYPKNIW